MHRVLFDESAGFQAAHSTALGNAIESVCPRVVMLQLDRDHVDVGLIRDPFNAATAGRWPRDGSDNDISARRGFRIDIGNWGQIIQNGRYVDADTGEWSYEKSVYNIAFVSEVTREVFVSSDPDHRHVELARLL
ncbi:MAG: hypothetical protein HQ581_26130 [Planctomycetes bacterium]|nr:hypothetical protein [Planctomycetota bacterium]